MRHPLDSFPASNRKALFFAFLAGTLILFAIFRVLDQPLQPNGIVAFELARTPEKAFQVMVGWEHGCISCPAIEKSRAYYFAAFGLGLDYLFMPIYALALSLGILLAAGRHPGLFARVGAWLGWGALAAPLFDATENFALLQELLNVAFTPWSQVAFWCAAFKFTLLVLGLIYALVGWLWPKKK